MGSPLPLSYTHPPTHPPTYHCRRHAYHLPCILSWEERGNSTCPMCGAELRAEELL